MFEVAETFPVDDESPASAVIREYQMVTNKCGITDLSWKSKIEVGYSFSKNYVIFNYFILYFILNIKYFNAYNIQIFINVNDLCLLLDYVFKNFFAVFV